MISIVFCESKAAELRCLTEATDKFLTLRDLWLYCVSGVIHAEVFLNLIECIGYWAWDTLNPRWDELLSDAAYTGKSTSWGALSMIDFLSFRWFFRIGTVGWGNFLIRQCTCSEVWRACCSEAGTILLLSLKAGWVYLNFISLDFMIRLFRKLFPGNSSRNQS